MNVCELCEFLFGTRNFYQIFGIDSKAPEKEVQIAYYKTALSFHLDQVEEDKRSDAIIKFNVVAHIHSVLSDPVKRMIYDETGFWDEEYNLSGEPGPWIWSDHWRIMFEKATLEELMTYEKENKVEEKDLKDWSKERVEEYWTKLIDCLKRGSKEGKIKAIHSLFTLLSVEAELPILKKTEQTKKKNRNSFPIHRLKEIVKSLPQPIDDRVLDKIAEFLIHKDVENNLWILAEDMCRDLNYDDDIPEEYEVYIDNLLTVICKLPTTKQEFDTFLCGIKKSSPDRREVKSAIKSMWQKLIHLHYSPATTGLLLMVLVDHIMPRMKSTVFLTDYLLAVLDKNDPELNFLGINGFLHICSKFGGLVYPENLYKKIYSLLIPAVLGTDYKEPLLILVDEILKSQDLSLRLVAGFAKKLAHLSLFSRSKDKRNIAKALSNILRRHQLLQPMYCVGLINDDMTVTSDPFDTMTDDPERSGALESRLWELKLMWYDEDKKTSSISYEMSVTIPAVTYMLK